MAVASNPRRPPAISAGGRVGWCWRRCSVLVVLSVRAAEPPRELRPARLRMLYSDSLFLNVNRNDALAAIKTWVETLGRRRGFKLAVEIDFYDRVEEATTAHPGEDGGHGHLHLPGLSPIGRNGADRTGVQPRLVSGV